MRVFVVRKKYGEPNITIRAKDWLDCCRKFLKDRSVTWTQPISEYSSIHACYRGINPSHHVGNVMFVSEGE